MTLEPEYVVYLVMGLLLGGILSFVILQKRFRQRSLDAKQYEQTLLDKYHDESRRASVLESKYHDLLQQSESLKSEAEKIRLEREHLQLKHARMESENKNLSLRMEEQQEEVEKIRKQFLMEFENIAARLLKSNAKEFAETNQKRIDEILSPFRDRIENFEKTVRDTHTSNLKEQSVLRNELKNLHDLNQKMSEEAKNLTHALKGDSKQRGNWGEMLLEKVLESSGLQKGIEYEREVVLTQNDSSKLRPDAVIHLPENKHIVIDSKVSLNAYEKSVEAATEQERQLHLKEHLNSVRAHIKSLSTKGYHLSEQLDTPEFVLMFMPVEPAFGAVVQYDKDIFNEAWDKRIVMVSPTTLLATLRTVASLWKHKKQTENALKIAHEGGKLYDRIASFLLEFEKLEKPLDQAKESYLHLREKLATSRQSLSRTAQRLRDMGAKTSRQLPEQYLNDNGEEEK